MPDTYTLLAQAAGRVEDAADQAGRVAYRHLSAVIRRVVPDAVAVQLALIEPGWGQIDWIETADGTHLDGNDSWQAQWVALYDDGAIGMIADHGQVGERVELDDVDPIDQPAPGTVLITTVQAETARDMPVRALADAYHDLGAMPLVTERTGMSTFRSYAALDSADRDGAGHAATYIKAAAGDTVVDVTVAHP